MKRIFYITANSLSVFVWNKGQIEDGPGFNNNADGIEAFSRYIAQDKDILTYCLVDLIEEQFHHDTIPNVSGNDRKILLLRKSKQLFRNTQYHCAEVQGRESTGRRNRQVLFMGVTNPDAISVWLTQAEQNKVPIVGIYSIAGLAQQLCVKLNIKSTNSLIFTQQSISGFRQTFLNNSQIKVSRLSQSKQLDEAGFQSVIISEVFRNQKYLQRLRLLDNSAPLDVYIFGDGHQLTAQTETFIDSTDIKYHFVDERDVAAMMGLNCRLNYGQCEYLFIHLLFTSKNTLNYAQVDDLRYNRLYRLRKTMLVASVLLSVAGLIWSSFNAIDVYHINQDNANLLEEINVLQRKYIDASEKLPSLDASARDMQHTVDTANQLLKNRTNPAFAMIAISRGLVSFPDVLIDDIDWIWSSDPNSKIGEAQLSEFDEANLGNESSDSNLYQIAIVRARVSPFNGNFDYAFSQVNNFIDELRKNPVFKEVSPIKLPLDTKSSSNLSGVTGYKLEQALALFEIRLVLSVDHEST